MEARYEQIDLENEKVRRIIHESFKEFSIQGFEQASTNNIVKQANVSRGLLYHYFKDKKDLYVFLISYSVDVLTAAIKGSVNYDERNIFKRLKVVTLAKLNVFIQYPYMSDFLQKYRFEDYRSKAVKDVKLPSSGELSQKIYYDNIDKSNYSDEEYSKLIVVINATFDAYNKSMQRRYDEVGSLDFDEMKGEILAYIAFLEKYFG